MKRIHSLESLRGLLALWVVVGHTIKHAAFQARDLGPFGLLADPGLAVDLFIMLSGFVIFFLLDQQRCGYRQFIVSRWFRLAPMFLATLAVSAATLLWQQQVIATSPFAGSAIANDAALHAEGLRALPQHLVAHILMIHGAISDRLLPASQYAIVGQAWSISVEWQFYLVAPLLFVMVARFRWHLLCAVLLGLCVLRAVDYGGEGFAVRQSAFFLLGIVSYYGWKHCASLTVPQAVLDFASVAAMAFTYFVVARTVSLMLWIVIMNVLVAQKRDAASAPARAVLALLHLPALQWLGKISYSVYLVHMLVFYAAQAVVLTWMPHPLQGHYLAALLALVVPGTLALSALSYSYIELPGIRLGRRWLVPDAGLKQASLRA